VAVRQRNAIHEIGFVTGAESEHTRCGHDIKQMQKGRPDKLTYGPTGHILTYWSLAGHVILHCVVLKSASDSISVILSTVYIVAVAILWGPCSLIV